MTSELGRRVRAKQRGQFLRSLLLMAPLVLFLLVVFVGPILLFMYRAIDSQLLYHAFPRTHATLEAWNGEGMPGEPAFAALAADIAAVDSPAKLAVIARTLNTMKEGFRSLLMKTATKLPAAPDGTWQMKLASIDQRWGDPGTWATLKQETGRFTPTYVLAALDLRRDSQGQVERVPPERRLYLPLLVRTLEISFEVGVLCLLLGYPTAFVLANLKPAVASALMICVMLPFWASLLVRTTAWIILLQGNGPVNSLLQWISLIDDPLEIIFNRFGALVAMVHVLLPYMILPLYSVMRNIPVTHMRAAQSLGANPRVAFLRVYLPQTVPGIAAGLLFVFILSLGYYITPALVGGPNDQMLSYMITYYVNEVVNWGMASALAMLLMLATLILLAALSRLFALRQFMK